MIEIKENITYKVQTIVQDISIQKRKTTKKFWFWNIPVMRPTIFVNVTLYVEVSEPLFENDIVLLDTGDRYLVVASNKKEFAKMVNVIGTMPKVNININGQLQSLSISTSEGSLTP